jgi:hypothetical protein
VFSANIIQKINLTNVSSATMYHAKRVAVNPRLPDQITASDFQDGALSPRDDEIQSGPHMHVQLSGSLSSFGVFINQEQANEDLHTIYKAYTS